MPSFRTLAGWIAFSLTTFCFGPSGLLEAAPAPGRTLTETTAADAYGKLPLSFEANHGQTDRRVRFLSRGRG